MQLYFVRHGESKANLTHMFSNRDVPHALTAHGRAQVEVLAEQLQGIRFGAFYASSLLRGRQSADILAAHLGIIYQVRRAVSYANFGKLRFMSEDDQQIWHECSRLLTNCIIFYNTTMLARVVAHKEATGDTADAALISQVSPVAWQHINLYGRYEFTTGPDPIHIDAMVEVLTQALIVSVEDAE